MRKIMWEICGFQQYTGGHSRTRLIIYRISQGSKIKGSRAEHLHGHHALYQ